MATPRDAGSWSGRSRAPARGAGPDEPDVLLDVPKLTVEEISLEVDDLHARIALEARLADLVELRVGADVEIARVALEIKGVEAEAQLKARLDNVLAIIERALDTVDKNPELLTELARSAQRAAGALGEEAKELAEGPVAGTGELAARTAQETASSAGPTRRRSRADGGGSDSGSTSREPRSKRS